MVQVEVGVRTEYLDVMTRVQVRRWRRKVLTMMVTCVHIRVCQETADQSPTVSEACRGQQAALWRQTVTSTLHTCLTSWLTSCLLCFTNDKTTIKRARPSTAPPAAANSAPSDSRAPAKLSWDHLTCRFVLRDFTSVWSSFSISGETSEDGRIKTGCLGSSAIKVRQR